MKLLRLISSGLLVILVNCQDMIEENPYFERVKILKADASYDSSKASGPIFYQDIGWSNLNMLTDENGACYTWNQGIDKDSDVVFWRGSFKEGS